MNDDLAIRICGLSKAYNLMNDAKGRGLTGLVDSFKDPARFWSVLFNPKLLCALDNISMDIPRGKAIALVGPNGAGKSTLLRILSRISEPTSGYADVYGSVGSLLDVGVGFHPELSGRENIFLGGVILGMSRRTVDQRLDQIVAFSGVENQLDTPIKYYSSGQFLRLGFAVAAFLDHDILILDEILSVGDIEFQRKCMEKVRELVRNGRTAIVVSHNFSMTSKLCDSGIYLRGGQLRASGDFRTVLACYISDSQGTDASVPLSEEEVPLGRPFIEAARITSGDDMCVVSGHPICFELTVKGGGNSSKIIAGLSVLNAKDHAVVSAISEQFITVEPDQRISLIFTLDDCTLVPGVYATRLLLLSPGQNGHPEQLGSLLLSPAFHVVPDQSMPLLPLTGEIEGVFKILRLEKECGSIAL